MTFDLQGCIHMKTHKNLSEQKRQVLNKSIDLLHKLANKKMNIRDVKKELSSILSVYFFSFFPKDAQIDEENKLKFEKFLKMAYEVVENLEGGKSALYEAIMLMNKIVVNYSLEESEKFQESVSDRNMFDQEFSFDRYPKDP